MWQDQRRFKPVMENRLEGIPQAAVFPRFLEERVRPGQIAGAVEITQDSRPARQWVGGRLKREERRWRMADGGWRKRGGIQPATNGGQPLAGSLPSPSDATPGTRARPPRCFLPLVGMGLRRLSMSPAFVPSIKEVVRHTTLEMAQVIAQRVLGMHTVGEIRGYLTRKVREAWPHVSLLDMSH